MVWPGNGCRAEAVDGTGNTFRAQFYILAYKDGSIGQRQSLLGEEISVPMGTRGQWYDS